jgi:hypothetical protein
MESKAYRKAQDEPEPEFARARAIISMHATAGVLRLVDSFQKRGLAQLGFVVRGGNPASQPGLARGMHFVRGGDTGWIPAPRCLESIGYV